MIHSLCKLASTLDDAGYESIAKKVDQLIAKLAGEREFDPPELSPKADLREVGRVHAEQDKIVGEHRLESKYPDLLNSFLAYEKHGPHKGHHYTLEDAKKYAEGYFDASVDEGVKNAQLAELEHHITTRHTEE